jgi:hypothetical protein
MKGDQHSRSSGFDRMMGPFSVFHGRDERHEGQGKDEKQYREGGMSRWHFLEQAAVVAELELRTALSGRIVKA